MHWMEGLVMIGAGIIACLIATGVFPGDPEQRANLERKMPLVRNRRLVWGTALVLWSFGAVVFANSVFGLGLPL